MAILTVREGGKEYVHQIESETVTIGRASTNTIEVHDAASSKEHCRLQLVGERWKLVDLESKNGTRLNGQVKNKAWLNNGDTIGIGKTQIRFGAGGAVRKPSRKAAPVTRAARARQEEESYEDEQPPRRYSSRSDSDKYVTWGLVAVGAVLMILVFMWVSNKFAKDEHSLQALEYARQLELNDQWNDALTYLQQNADPDGNMYGKVEAKIKELRDHKDGYVAERKNQEAKKLVSKLGLLIRAYHSGSEKIQAEEILARVERLKTEYPDTEIVGWARKEFRAWFAGVAPERAVNLLRSGSKLERDWAQTEAAAREYEKDWHFREARETYERFLTIREASLEADDLQFYRDQVDEALKRVNMAAQNYYNMSDQRAIEHVRRKRYDLAIAEYKKVIDNFGIDQFVRKAQAEIAKIEEKKANE